KTYLRKGCGRREWSGHLEPTQGIRTNRANAVPLRPVLSRVGSSKTRGRPRPDSSGRTRCACRSPRKSLALTYRAAMHFQNLPRCRVWVFALVGQRFHAAPELAAIHFESRSILAM